MKHFRIVWPMLLITAVLSISSGQTRIYPSSKSQYETHLAVNPTNPANIIAVAITDPFETDRKIGAYYTLDGGANWSGSDSISAVSVRCADPVVIFDPAGIAYCIYQSFNVKTLYCQKSTDGGVSWGNAIIVLEGDDYPIDRPWVAVAPTPNAQGHFDLYALISQDQTDQNSRVAMVLSKSIDGANSFNPVHLFSTAATKYQGATLGIGPDGSVWVGFSRLDSNQTGWPVTDVFVHQSTDGGSTFSQSASWSTTQIGVPEGSTKNHYIKSGQIRVESFPRLAVDNSISTNTGTVYVAWSSKNGSDGSADLTVMKKPPGQSWTNAGSVTVSGDQFAPAVAVGPDGSWSLLYYEIASGQDQVHVRHTVRRPNGTITNDLHVGKSPTFEITSSYKPFIGDYIGVGLWYGKSFGVWTEARGNVSGGESQQQAYFGTLATEEVLPSGYVKTTATQVDKSDSAFGALGKYASNQFIYYTTPYDFRWTYNSPNNVQILRADQDLKPGTSQKYITWLTQSDVINHRSFTISSGTTLVKAQFELAYDATLRAQLVETGVYGGTLDLKDPWYPDDSSDGKGIRNRGSSPNATIVAYGSNNIGLSSVFKGAFLNQSVTPGQPYYSVRAAETQTVNSVPWVFWKWDTSGVTLTTPTNLSGGYYESPVIFRPWGTRTVTATYKAHLASNASDVLTLGGQRRLAAGTVSNNTDHLLA